MSPTGIPAADRLNRDCQCIGTDVDALRAQLEHELGARGLREPFVQTHPHLFSPLPVFVAPAHTEAMRHIIAAVERVVATAAWREAVLADAPAIARVPQAARGAFMGYDFHIGANGPQLIEINSNAGGAFLNAAIASAQRACCVAVTQLLTRSGAGGDLDANVCAMFRNEWRIARGDAPLRRIAIVDTAPAAQYLYPEFLLAQRLFERDGIRAVIVDPSELLLRDGRLECEGVPVDLVYNRLTDFYFEDPAHAHLAAAYRSDAAVFTPHPEAHALYANKHNLVLLGDSDWLRAAGLDAATIDTLLRGVPRTRRVFGEDADALWADRKHWFFKPAGGFGSRGAYRGDKLTRKVFAEILEADYVAQAVVPPSERHLAPDQPLKLDLRNYVYDGAVQLVAARLYQGQTTNFRTPGGGFAPVYHPPALVAD
ncbi:MAG: hypothetical protein IPG63_02175 [Xanthomonadales bacterium]|nr:hypothetical protein [Xanthomonadales bacterium]